MAGARFHPAVGVRAAGDKEARRRREGSRAHRGRFRGKAAARLCVVAFRQFFFRAQFFSNAWVGEFEGGASRTKSDSRRSILSSREREAALNHRLKAGRNEQRGEGADFVCECADLRCNATLELTPSEQVERRERPARFWVKPGHALIAVERVVAESDRYSIVVGDRAPLYVVPS